ncbi:hypothetical protein [Bradyrhizobium sp. OAE829]|uniref:hypothetical protein n=1 Tax=Bradyrhizobium sp. OAE829 TaxID=2663807 RepID=UPI00178B9AC6
MIKPPDKMEWNTAALSAKGRTYLDDNLSFEKIAAQVIKYATVISTLIEPYHDAPHGEEDGRQIIFVVHVGLKTCDLLYNAPDGMRGRYWQSPDHGFAATKQLIAGLTPKLISCADAHRPMPPDGVGPMSAECIKVSLGSVSAKMWPREYDGKWLFEDDQLDVPRWKNNEDRAKTHVGWWRQSPISGDLEVKGALIGIDKTEYIPPRKRDRSWQIYTYGFT